MNKETLSLSIKANETRYRIKSFSSDKMAILGMFLATDYNSSIDNWFKDFSMYAFEGNITYLEKKDRYVFLGDLLWEEGLPFVELKLIAEDFICFLRDWRRIAKNKPKEVIISYKNGKISHNYCTCEKKASLDVKIEWTGYCDTTKIDKNAIPKTLMLTEDLLRQIFCGKISL